MNYIKESFSYKLTFIGGKELFMEGHRGISKCTESEIVIRVRGGKISIHGEELHVKEINEDELFVQGKMEAIGVIK